MLHTFTTAGRRIGVVDWVFADPERAPRGTGSALRDAGLAWFEEVGADGLVASIEPFNTASETLHPAGGFAPIPWKVQLAPLGVAVADGAAAKSPDPVRDERAAVGAAGGG